MPPVTANTRPRIEGINWTKKDKGKTADTMNTIRPETMTFPPSTKKGNRLPKFPHASTPTFTMTKGTTNPGHTSTMPPSSSTVRGRLPTPRASGNLVLPKGIAGYPGGWGETGFAILAPITIMTLLATIGLAVVFHKRAKRYRHALIQFAMRLADRTVNNGPQQNYATQYADLPNPSNRWSEEAIMEDVYDTVTESSFSDTPAEPVKLPGAKYATWGAYGGYDPRHRNKTFLVSDGIEDFEWEEPTPQGIIVGTCCPKGYPGWDRT